MSGLQSIGESNDIAIVGMSGLFPGARNLDEYWRNLKSGVSSISYFGKEELKQAGAPADIIDNPSFVPAYGCLQDREMFAADFFNFTPNEAMFTDPQIRLFIECAWHAFEDAGYHIKQYDGKVGVFAGAGLNTYFMHNLQNHTALDSAGALAVAIGNQVDFLPTQVAYKLNLKGPAVNINTACSTSLVCIHMACESLLNHESDIMLAGGASVNETAYPGYLYQEGGVFSKDGYCRAFDKQASGTVPADGVGAVVLKRLDDAIADGDNIYAIIKATSINNDGAQKVGFTAPGIQGQTDVIASALALAEIDSDSIGYVETHGTGTQMGDPIEIKALTKAFRLSAEKSKHCAIGSVKSNVGHLGAAAGVAGLIKTALCLKHNTLVPSLHYEQANPEIDFEASPFYVSDKLHAWPESPAFPRRAGVSSFGIGGTNAHAILEEYKVPSKGTGDAKRNWRILPVSAQNQSCLAQAKTQLGQCLEATSDLPIQDVAYTLQVGRESFAQRSALLANSVQMAVTAATAECPRLLVNGEQVKDNRVVFMFPGVGEQYQNMAAQLYQVEPVFRACVDQCNDQIMSQFGIDLKASLFGTDGRQFDPNKELAELTGSGKIDLRSLLMQQSDEGARSEVLSQTRYAHVALFVVQYALAQLWQSWGVRPKAMIGHSLGEYVAACLAGVMSLADALHIVAQRALFIDALPAGNMLAVGDCATRLDGLLTPGVNLAAVNSDNSCVLAGEEAELLALQTSLQEKGVVSRLVNSSHAFHSAMMEPARPYLLNLFNNVTLNPPEIPYVSNLTGDWITPEQATDPAYWAAHTCQTVKFADGINTLTDKAMNVFLEIGVGNSLGSFVQQCQSLRSVQDGIVLQSLPARSDKTGDEFVINHALATLWCRGVEVDWHAYQLEEPLSRTSLPGYPLQREPFWFEPEAADTDNGQYHQPAKVMKSYTISKANAQQASREEVHAAPKYAAPEGDIEALLAEQWRLILGVDSIGRNDHFFRLGGSSLLGVQMISRLKENLEIGITLRMLFDHPVLQDFASVIEHLLLADLEGMSDEEANALIAQNSEPSQPDFQATPYVLPNGMEIMQFNRVETDHFYHDIFDTRVYAKNGIVLDNNCTVFDVGGNVGLFSLFVVNTVKGANIYTFEPAPPVFDVLSQNLANADANIKLFNMGISNTNHEKQLVFYPNSTGMSSFHADKDEEKTVLRAIIENQGVSSDTLMDDIGGSMDTILEQRFQEIPFNCQLRTLSSIIESEAVTQIDLLKIDVQKCELEVLEGIEQQHWQRIRQVVIEVHDVGEQMPRVIRLLEGNGFSVFKEQDDLYENSNIWNLYATRP
ncbi:type I polyketide synthase [Pseudoalteromonas sp. OOF1S-7]|uniref:type I polyketide synthase n=1 Tax=Pseudoalteromonas sp. OOF1S-7 TaxID=2917757 RepID=UPI001EF46D27|nr:type I polyketide synthase [Pseudoalteromonas sp. OOF1S-7]MCG7534489.1 FkbM family methyltransferase [Pseudoalteromonas sp. OOF1S-7]